jgi:D-aminoacyl-tRNA deacylase
MNLAIISSLKDQASVNIKENLLNNFDFNELQEQFENNPIFQVNNNKKIIKIYTINSELIFTDNLDKEINADIFIFISKHKAKEERASLTAHSIGNFGKAMVGGKENTLCISPSFLLKNVLVELNKNVENTDYEATVEATHHGPFLEKPVLFLELGSNEKHWNDKEGGNIVSKSLMKALEKFNFNNYEPNNDTKNELEGKIEKSNGKLINNENDNIETLNNEDSFGSTLVIGGSHYNHVANKAMLQTGYAVGHICPKYNFINLNEEMLRQAWEKTIPKPEFVLLDWKGLGKEKQTIVEMLEKLNIRYKRSDKFFEM